MVLFSLLLLTLHVATAQTTVTIGSGASSSSTRGPFQRADTNSSTVFSRFIQVYTAAELAAVGIPNGASLSQFNWELGSSNIIVGSGDATLKIYVKNSSATAAMADTWANLIAGSSLVHDEAYNTTNNFPGANGWMPFSFSSPFVYTGGALEIAVDWDCSQVSTPAFSGNGAIKWRWSSTAPDTLVVKKTSSSSPSSNITDLKDERANIQIVYNATSCSPPINLNATNLTTTSADFTWSPSVNAVAYNWKVVAAGAGPGGTALDSGNTATTSASTTSLMELTSYDLYVEADCGGIGTSGFGSPHTFLTVPMSESILTIGVGASSSSTRGPFQRSDTNSSTVFSRFVHVYTANELAGSGLVDGVSITALNWELASSNVVIGNGNAALRVYLKNSTATEATADTWANLIAGSSLLVDNSYNTTNNFPGANGWMPFAFSAPFVYTGGSIEIAVDWDCSQVSTPAFSGDGSLKWRWSSTSPDTLVVKKTSSSSPSSNISDLKDERANLQFVYATPICAEPTALNATNITTTSADLSWADSSAMAYNWKVVLAGAGGNAAAVDSGNVSGTMVTTTALSAVTSYDFYVEADCGAIGSSGFAGPYTFITLCAATPATAITTLISDVACNGDSTGSIDLTVTDGVPGFSFLWSNSDTTEDLTSLPAGLYTVTITDGDGCPYFDSVMVAEAPALNIATTIVPDTANAGLGTVSVMVSGGTPPYSYVWDGMAGDADSTGLAAGMYEIMVTDASDCSETVQVSVDNTVGISSLDFLTHLSIQPNPTTGRTRVELDLTQAATIRIAVYSIRGELVEKMVLASTHQLRESLDLSTHANGLYFVRIAINEEVLTKKVLLQK